MRTYFLLIRCGLLLPLCIAVASWGCTPSPSVPAPVAPPAANSAAVPAAKEEPAARTVKLVVDFGDGVERTYDSVAWVEGDSVLSLLDRLKSHSEPLTYAVSGKGDAAFVSKIDDVKNQGTGSEKKNWLFWVNGKFADRSAGVYMIQAGDEVAWKFTQWPVK